MDRNTGKSVLMSGLAIPAIQILGDCCDLMTVPDQEPGRLPRFSPALLPDVVDPQQIQMVLTNLATNAYQAVPDGRSESRNGH